MSRLTGMVFLTVVGFPERNGNLRVMGDLDIDGGPVSNGDIIRY